MSTTNPSNGLKKRKQTVNPSNPPTKKPRAETQGLPHPPPPAAAPPSLTPSLIGPHEAIIAALSPRHNVLAASVISSTQIRKRVAHVTSHLAEKSNDSNNAAAAAAAAAAGDDSAQLLPARVALLYARPADVCKMITVAEQCKRILGERGRPWYQYNQLFDLPEEAPKKKKKRRDVVEETVLENEPQEYGSDSESEAFEEAMESRFENAVLPPPRTRTHKSMRIFLSLEPVPELRSRDDVTVQSSEEAKS